MICRKNSHPSLRISPPAGIARNFCEICSYGILPQTIGVHGIAIIRPVRANISFRSELHDGSRITAARCESQTAFRYRIVARPVARGEPQTFYSLMTAAAERPSLSAAAETFWLISKAPYSASCASFFDLRRRYAAKPRPAMPISNKLPGSGTEE